jgi:transposase
LGARRSTGGSRIVGAAAGGALKAKPLFGRPPKLDGNKL